ncbi:uncharacterized protein LOC141593081 [Silene latifolia]|uniref:uncharacterized protein LOC141593081 n=1 Tax=Silene latifolia TaxID=37657 RepID=UPI003D76DC97
MIHLLFSIIFAQATIILLLLFKTPLRNLVVSGIDIIKRGRGPIVVKTVSSTIFVVFSSSVYSVFKLTHRGDVDDGAPSDLNPTEQVLFAKHLLEASLMGFILFLGLMIDRLHNYIRELELRRKTMEELKKTEGKFDAHEEVKAREMQVNTFKDMIRQMDSELETAVKEATASEATVEALRKQSEGLLLEYDRLLAENQELRNELQIVDLRVSHSAVKKDS